MAIVSLNHTRLDKTESEHKTEFQKVTDKMAAICTDFKWLGFWISDPFQNPDHLQPNLF